MRRAQLVGMMLLLLLLGAACGGSGSSSEERPLGLDSDEIAEATATLVVPTVPPTPTPTSTPEAFIYVVRQGDTLSTIAEEFGTTAADITAVNDLLNPNLLSIGQQVEIPQGVAVVYNSDGTVRPGERLHTVQGGDTLLGIVQQYGTTLDKLLEANSITIDYVLQIGEQIIVPAEDEEPAP